MQIIKNKVHTLFCTVLVLCSFKVFSAPPKWITEPTKVYPSEAYITGVGSGSKAQEAELDAIRKVASFFGQDISSTSKASKRIKQAQDSVGKTATLKSTAISDDIQNKVSVENLIGVEIKESFNDGKTFYAIAVMDKQKARAELISSIESNDRKIQELLKYDGNDEFSFIRYASVDLAREIATINEKLIARLRALDSAKADGFSKTCKTKAELSKLRNQLAKQIPIYIEIENDFEGQIKGAFAQMVKGNGFNTSEDSAERYSITANITLVKRDTKDGKTVQCIYTLEGFLRDTLLEENLMPINIQGREGSTDITDVTLRAYRAMSSKIKDNIKNLFVNYLNSL